MPIQKVYMQWGTWLWDKDNTIPHGNDSYMHVGSERRPLIKFNNDGFSGQILSATLNLYCSTAGSTPWKVYKVNRACGVNATWANTGVSSGWWRTAGCDSVNEDRSGVAMTAETQLGSTGWHAVTITSLSELLGVINGLDVILLRNTETGRGTAVIEKSPSPYLAITYESSIVGGVQIF